ncbi:hypothetical protein ABW20_dc0107480 [Dactylellina cionopaga]|nr:hypothetical protein ABW20_dc0107480 [Dactylellina cionopaga]
MSDTDGIGYLLTEDRANGVRIDKLSSDYLSVSNNVYLWSGLRYEAPAMVKVNGVYFMFASQQSGWSTNDNKYSTATSISGPWSAWKSFAPSGTNTLNSQTTFILTIGSNYFYLGDRWVSSNLGSSTYVWMPLTISGTLASMTNHINWIVDPNSGSWKDGSSENSYEGESASLSNGAKSVSCSGCSGSKAAGYIGGSSNGIIQFNNVAVSQSGLTSVRIKYENGDSNSRYASVSVNGIGQTIAFQSTSDGNTPYSSTLNCQLNAGSSNTIKFSAVNGGNGEI